MAATAAAAQTNSVPDEANQPEELVETQPLEKQQITDHLEKVWKTFYLILADIIRPRGSPGGGATRVRSGEGRHAGGEHDAFWSWFFHLTN